MKTIRRSVVRTLDSLGVKRPVKAGLNSLLAVGGLPPLGRPRVFHDLERLARTPRPRPAQSVGRLLIFTMRGWTTHVAVETLLGEAAAQRGLEPTFYTCGGPLPLCGITTFRAPDPTPCGDCFGYVSRYFETLGFPFTTLGELVSDEERRRLAAELAAVGDADLPEFVHDDLPLGRMVRTSVNWFLLRGTPEPGARWVAALRGFLESGLIVQAALERLLERTRPDRVLCLSGLFFAERLLRAIALRRGIPVTTYERGFMPQTWVFSHDDDAPEYRIGKDFLRLGDRPLEPPAAERLDDYLKSRAAGGADTRTYWPAMEARREAVVRELGLDPRRPLVSSFTNITWDSAIQDHDVAFDDMFDWLEHTVRFFAPRDDAQLVIRVHPAEVRLAGQETSEQVADVLAARMGRLPPAVRIVPATSGLSSYTLGQMSRCSLVYTSTMGLELACAGIPVLVAGDTHYRGLGFTHDVERREDYAALLERCLREPQPPDVERARRYAHFFFFRFMIPLSFVREDDEHQVRIPLASLAELGPGRNAALDAVMAGLVDGVPIFFG